MTCSRRFGRMLQASSLALIGMLTVVGCGGSDSTPGTTKKDAAPDGTGGTTPTGVVKVDKAVLDFGSIDIGSTSTAQTVNVQVTVAPVAINATVTGSGFAISGTTCAPVQAVGACTISVKFAPASIGAATGTLAIGNAAVALSGAGQNAGTFSVTDRVDLGTLLVGATASAVVQVVPSPSVTGLTCIASGSNLTLASQTCAATGAIAAPCTFTFTFKAATAGVKSDAVVCSAGGTVKQTTVAAAVVTPAALTINPPTLAFTASVGGTFVATFNVSNSGGSPTGNLSATISAGATDFAITSNDCVVPLASLAICKIQVTFKPASVGAKTGTLTVADATVGTVPATAALTGTAIAATALVITPATSDFGTVEAPATKTTNFTIKNTGGTASDAVVIGGGSAEFVVDAALCNNLPLAPAASCAFTVTFKPATAGAKTAAIIATVNGVASATAQVTGTGTVKGTPVLAVSPPTLDFGSITVGTTKGPLSLTVTNSGTAATGVLSVVKKDSTSSVGGASQFTFTSPDCNGASLEPGESCTVAVTYSPTITGSASAILTISDGAVSSANGTVIGIALTIPTLSITCTPAAFDSTVVGQTSANVICTIKNVVTIGGAGQAPQESGAITAAVTGDFTIVTNACTASLQPNESCTLAVAFKPTAKGTRTGKLTVTSSNRAANDTTLTATGWLPVQVEAYSASAITASNPTGHVTSLYDFGNAAMGSSASAVDATKVLTLAVYVHAAVGNLAISGTDLQFSNATAAADFTGANFASGTYTIGGVSVVNPAACASISTVAPTPNANPYCYMTIDFTPKSKTLKSNTFKAAGADGTSSDTVAMQGTGTGPLTINPSPLTFDAVAVGSSGTQVLTLTVKNTAGSAGTGATIKIEGANAADFVLVTDNISNQTIGSSAIAVPIRLTVPAGTAVGPLAATVTVTATIAGVLETTTATLAGAAVTGAGITATLNGAFADTVVTGTSAPVTVTVKNTGALATDKLVATLGGAGDFVIDATLIPGQSQGTCVIGTTKLDPGASCDLKVWFQPSPGLGVSKRSNTLAIGSAVGGTVVLTLTGNATGLLAVTPGTQDLGTFALGELQPTVKAFTITNNGGASINPTVQIINDTTVGQTGASEIAIKTNNCTTIGPAGSTSPLPYCTVDVWMLTNSSALPGLRAATLKVTGTTTTGGTQAGTATAIVTGTAAKKASLKFTPVDTAVVTRSASTVDRDFGDVVLGSTSGAQTFVVSNVGGFDASALTVSFYDLAAGGAASSTKHAKTSDLTVGGTCLSDGGAVKAGKSCTITVAFHPTKCTYPYSTECPFTTTQLGNSVDAGAGYGVQLAITATNGTATTGEYGPKLYGNAIDTNRASIVASNGMAMYDFGTLAATDSTGKTAVFTVTNGGATAFTLAASPTLNITNALTPGTAVTSTVSGVGEFTSVALPAGVPTTNDCHVTSGTKVVAAGGYCLFAVKWATSSSATGTRNMKITLVDNSSATVASVNAIARVLTSASLVVLPYPLASTTSTALDFGTPVMGVDSLTKTLTIINVGELATTADLKIVDPSSATVAGQVKVMTGTTCQGSGSTLASLGTCVLNLAVHPADTNLQNDVYGVKDITLSTGGSSLLASGAVKAMWTAKPASALTATPTLLAFDTVTSSTYPGTGVLSATAMTITIKNAASAPDTGPLSIATSSADFYIDPSTTESTCLASSLAFSGLAANAECKLRVVFSPAALATPAKTGTLTVKSTAAADLTVQLSGTAIPALTVSRTTSVGTFAGTTSAANASDLFPAASITAAAGSLPEETFQFTKATGAPATSNLSAILSGTNADQFKIVDDQCTGVDLHEASTGVTARTTCTVKVRFAPTTATAGKKATLTVIDPLSGTPANSISVDLSGNGNP